MINKAIVLIFAMIFMTQSLAWGQTSSITIAGKNFTEQDVLVDLIAVLLKEERPNLKIHKKKSLGGTSVTFESVKNGSIDMYVEYSGTAYFSIYKQSQKKNRRQIHDYLVEKFYDDNLFWSPQLGFNNTYALLIKDLPDNTSIKRVSDLRPISRNLLIGTDPEVSTRPDGYSEFLNTYDMNFKSHMMMNSGLLYQSLEKDKVDVIIGYSTDGRIPVANLKILQDDLGFFPDYSASVIVNRKTLERHPWIHKALNKLYGEIDAETMQRLNAKVDFEKFDSVAVAKEFAAQKLWINPEGVTDPQSQSFLEFLNSKKSFLLKKIYEHLFLTFLAFAIVSLIGITLGVMSYYNERVQKFIFLLVNLCQTIPSLALFGMLIPLLGIGVKPSLVALVLYSLLPIVRNTYTGLCEVEASILETCEILGMNKRQILFKVLLPMSLMTISAGLRTSLVIIVGTATIASFIGAGGLGDPIFQGISSLNNRLILLGALPAALLAIFLDLLLHYGTRFLLSPGLTGGRQNMT